MPSDEATQSNRQLGDASEARREYSFFRRLALTALMLSCAVAVSLNLVDPDLWGHVLYGQELLADGKLPTAATHTFTAPDYPWINHEHLAEIAFALGFEILGVYGMLILKCLWGMAILGLMVAVARRRGVDALAAWGLMLLVANNLVAFFPMRPQLFSFMWFALLLVLLDRVRGSWDRRDGDSRWLWFAPVIMAVWTNSHGGFVAGLCILEAYLAGSIVELFVQNGRAAWPSAMRYAGVGVASSLATLLNPYGIRLHLWLWESLGKARPEITEWAPPRPGDAIFLPFLMLVGVMLVSLLATRCKRSWTEMAILALVTWQATSHLRHISFLAILCGFWLPAHFQSALSRLRPQNSEALPVVRLNPWLARAATIALAATIGLFCAGLVNRLSDFPVKRSRYPVDALQFMVNQNLHGKLVVSFNWAQYAIAALKPHVQVAFDGRFRTCYPQEIVDMHFDFLLGENNGARRRSPRSGPVDNQRVLEFGDPNLVLVDRSYPESVHAMHQAVLSGESEWTILYQDGTAQIWGRRDRYDDPASPDYLEPAERILTNTQFTSAEQWPALPRRVEGASLAEGSPPATSLQL